MKYNLLILYLLAAFNSTAQIDSVNTKSKLLSIQKIPEGTSSYLVYMQDSLHGAKYNFELWDRTISKQADTLYLDWTRQKSEKEAFHNYNLKFGKGLTPYSEKVYSKTIKGDQVSIERKHFLLTDNSVHSNKDTTLHNAPAVAIPDLKFALNWELDLETLTALAWEEEKAYAICFYHPGSKTPPKYYTYFVDRSEAIPFNGTALPCWVVKLVHNEQLTTEFWVDKQTNRVLLVKDFFMGRFRFKKLMI